MRIVYIHIPRTAGNTIKNLFPLEVLVWSHDLRHKNYRFFSRAEDDFVFSFIRDPMTRFLSAFYYLKNGGRKEEDNRDGYLSGVKAMDVVDFVRCRLEQVSRWQIHFLPQTVWLQNLDHTDFVGQYKSMERDYSHLTRKLGLPIKSLTYQPTGKDVSKRQIKTIEPIIKDVYAKDYELIEALDEREN